MTVRPLGLMQDISAAMRKHVVLVLDMLMAEVKERIAGDPEAIERDLVDEVARWAARQEERLFPSGRDERGRIGLTPEQYRARVDAEFADDEPQPLIHEPTNGHGKQVDAPECSCCGIKGEALEYDAEGRARCGFCLELDAHVGARRDSNGEKP